MRKKDTFDVLCSFWSSVADIVAVFAGFMLATWIRFSSGWIPIAFGTPLDVYDIYSSGACVATLLFLAVFRSLDLYVRPQMGSFANKIPRIFRATGIGVVLTVVLAFAVKNLTTEFSSVALAMSFFTITFFVLLERYILFRIEWNLSRHSNESNQVLVLGADSIALHVMRTLRKEPMLRSRIAGFLRTNSAAPDKDLPPELIKGTLADLGSFISSNRVDQIILTDSSLDHKRIVEIIMLCERNLITFNMVPDLFRIMTSSMDMQSLNDIPLLGIARWPLDLFWNRIKKRTEDIIGSAIGLIISAPVIGVSAWLIKRSSPGPAFFIQERCGENGQVFKLYKLRTMPMDAEKESGPVWAKADDPRRTKIGAFLRKHNLDELPQLWNVFLGEMSLVGPRPERPHFVEQFKEDVGRYMWRHVSKPGITGWAQVNGLRGNTSIEERIKHDLYYLENWSISFDLKILLRTIFATENAY